MTRPDRPFDIAAARVALVLNAASGKRNAESKEEEISALIEEEKLKPEETRRFIANALRDGTLKTTGTAIDKIMPPVSRFGGLRTEKKQGIIEKLLLFFEKYLGLV